MPLTILEKFSMEVCILNYETFLEGAIS